MDNELYFWTIGCGFSELLDVESRKCRIIPAGRQLRVHNAVWQACSRVYTVRSWKTFKDKDCTSSLGNLCHRLTVLIVRKFLLVSSLNICFYLCPLSVILLPHTAVKSPALSTQWPYRKHWGLLSGPWTHYCSKINKLNSPSHFSQGKCSRHHHHGACPWTASSLLMSFLHQRGQNWTECLDVT